MLEKMMFKTKMLNNSGVSFVKNKIILYRSYSTHIGKNKETIKNTEKIYNLMLDYMEYVKRQFEQCTSWNEDNSYENITQTSENILNFEIPVAVKLQVSNSSTPYFYNTLELGNNRFINGSLTYLYTSSEDVGALVKSSPSVPLQDMIQSFRYIEPYYHRYTTRKVKPVSKYPVSLIYGRMYYPTSVLEAMYIKKFPNSFQFILKCLSSKSGPSILTAYAQKNTGANCQEFIFSTNEALVGYRFVHNFISSGSKSSLSLYNNSSLSIGSEIWCAILNSSPGCSTTLRYCTHATNTGKPLIFTLSLNPLFGHVSSTYSCKINENLTFCTKYDFNLYSIQSNLSLGLELWKSKRRIHETPTTGQLIVNDWATMPPNGTAMYHHLLTKNEKSSQSSQKLLNDLNLTFQSSLQKINRERNIIESFITSFKESDFTQVLKASTSLRDMNMRILWEGRIKGFLISAGLELTQPPEISINGLDSLEHQSWSVIRPSKFGVQLQYST